MSNQEIVLNPEILLPKVNDELAEKFKWWNDLFNKHSLIHNKIAHRENVLRNSQRESIISPEAKTFSAEEEAELSKLSCEREINQCYLGLATMQLQELRNQYITSSSTFKLEPEEKPILS